MANNSAGYPWLKFYTAWLDNPRFFRLSDLAKAVYFEIYLLAGRSDAGGVILAGDDLATIADIAGILRRDDQVLQAGLTELQAFGLVIVDSDQVMVTRFETDQGPSMLEKREQWRIRQQTKRALARGENTDSDPEKSKNSEKEQEKDKIQELKIKDTDTESHSEVTQESQRESRVTQNTQGGGGDSSKIEKLESDILKIWNDITGQDYKTNQAFKAMIKTLFDAEVTAEHFKLACMVQREKGKIAVNSPLSLQSWAINVKNSQVVNTVVNDPDITDEAMRQERFRALARELEKRQQDQGA